MDNYEEEIIIFLGESACQIRVRKYEQKRSAGMTADHVIL